MAWTTTATTASTSCVTSTRTASATRRSPTWASRSFASAQELAGLASGCVAYRSPQEAARASELVFVTTPDDAVEGVVETIAWRPGQGVIHCSGVSSLDVLEPSVRQGAVAGSFHPLQAFSSVENGVKSIPGTTFGIEGASEMRRFLNQMALDIGGRPIFVEAKDKALYHLSGVMVGGLLSTLASVAAQLWEELGFSRAEGVTALVPMMRQVSFNLESAGVPGAVAGPYARGDVGTVRKHLEALRSRAPEVLPLYCEMALAGLPFAVEKGTLEPGRADEISELVQHYKEGSVV